MTLSPIKLVKCLILFEINIKKEGVEVKLLKAQEDPLETNKNRFKRELTE